MSDVMQAIQISCPHCSQAYRVKAEYIGKDYQCKKCGQSFVLEGPGGDASSAESVVRVRPAENRTQPVKTDVPATRTRRMLFPVVSFFLLMVVFVIWCVLFAFAPPCIGFLSVAALLVGITWAYFRSHSWYVRLESGQVGPISTAEVASLYQSGQASATTPIRNGGDREWYSGVTIVEDPDRFFSGLKWAFLFAIAGFFFSYFVFGSVCGVRIPFDKLSAVLFPPDQPGQALVQLFAGMVVPPIEEIRRGLEDARTRILVSTFSLSLVGAIAGVALARGKSRIVKQNRQDGPVVQSTANR